MKKVCLTMMMLVLMVVGAQAQAVIGLKGGYSFFKAVGSDVDDDAEGSSGFHLGAMTEFELTESVFLRPEVLFNYTSDDFGSQSWITIPVMGTVFLTENVNLQFGPYLGILATASDEDGENLRDAYSGFDFGVAIGAGYELESGLNFTARYNYGLTNPFSSDSGLDEAKIAISQFQLSVGYFLGR